MHSPRQGKPSAVSPGIEKRLRMYSIAARAAGVSVLALAPSAQAKVVYTPADQVVGGNGVYELDVNGDGTVDFLIQQWNFGNWASNNQLLADAAFGNALVGQRNFASALQSGASIGPNQKFISGGYNGQPMLSVTHFTTGGTSYVHGFWLDVRNRYLGLKFQINGQTHYGWARLTVTRELFHFTAALTGYAYETQPNTAIKAGQTSGGEADSITSRSNRSQVASLGQLALGAQPVPVGRQP